MPDRVATFEKVSLGEFYDAMKDGFYSSIEPSMEAIERMYNNIVLPVRATSGSAGYDFVTPISVQLRPGESINIPTGIRVRIEDGWWLLCLPRSGLGFKYRLQLANTAGVIDSDYYYSDNEGHIHAKITNDCKADKIVTLNTGSRFMQGIFVPYGITYDDDAKDMRVGGFGSTGL